ncbi:hypothetical protein LZ31DRAFT_179972 [Colletotrichum somersetense]|nr:hypothetical protein LZ31DRAFT_179972 [Colletotrichum somersetense]
MNLCTKACGIPYCWGTEKWAKMLTAKERSKRALRSTPKPTLRFCWAAFWPCYIDQLDLVLIARLGYCQKIVYVAPGQPFHYHPTSNLPSPGQESPYRGRNTRRITAALENLCRCHTLGCNRVACMDGYGKKLCFRDKVVSLMTLRSSGIICQGLAQWSAEKLNHRVCVCLDERAAAAYPFIRVRPREAFRICAQSTALLTSHADHADK